MTAGSRRRSAALAGLLAAAAGAGCGQGVTDPCTADATPFARTWQYTGAQTAPGRTALAGQLSLQGGACGRLTGALDVVETDGNGRTRRLTGAVDGRTIDATSVRLDVTLDGGTREHVGTLRADSLTGTWVVPLGAAGASAGTFVAVAAR